MARPTVCVLASVPLADSGLCARHAACRRSQPALQAHHEDHFVADAATLSSAVRWGGRSARLSPHTVLSVGDASYDGGVDFIWEVFRPTSCAPTSARRTELRGARQVEIPAYSHGCVASGNCVLQVSAPGLGALSYGVPMYSLEQAPGAVDGRVRLQRLTQVRATVSYSTTLREVGSEWRLDSAEGVYETVLADAAYEEAAAAGSTRTVTVTLTDGAGPQRLTYPALTGGWRLVGLLVSASISGLCLLTLPPFFLLMLTHIMENNGLPPFCWRGRLSFRGW